MKYQHKTHVIETAGWVSKGKIEPGAVDDEIRSYGEKGYRLVSVIPVSDGSVGTKRITLFFEREIPDSDTPNNKPTKAETATPRKPSDRI